MGIFVGLSNIRKQYSVKLNKASLIHNTNRRARSSERKIVPGFFKPWQALAQKNDLP
jgi:hypothetical protein